MARITVLGGTGYAGSHVVREAARRGHTVTSVSRHSPAEPLDGVAHRAGSILEPGTLDAAVADTDVVVVAVPPRGAMEGRVAGAIAELADRARTTGARVGVIGGAGSLDVAPGGPRLVDTDAFPAEYRPESLEMADVLDAFRAGDGSLDWFYVSPAAGFGGFAPGEATGTFRLGGDVLLTDEEGASFVSGADLATAIVDEIEQPAHRRARFTVAY
jgi:uncharacterized protein